MNNNIFIRPPGVRIPAMVYLVYLIDLDVTILTHS